MEPPVFTISSYSKRTPELNAFLSNSDYEFAYMLDPLVDLQYKAIRGFWVVTDADGRVVGFAEVSLVLKTNSMEIVHLYIDKACRRLGLASKIVELAKREAMNNNRAYINADCTGEVSLLFFANGFVPAGPGTSGLSVFVWVPPGKPIPVDGNNKQSVCL